MFPLGCPVLSVLDLAWHPKKEKTLKFSFKAPEKTRSFPFFPAPYLAPVRGLSGEGNGTPLQYSYLGNPMDQGAWEATVHGVAKSRTRLSDFTFYFHALEDNGNPLQCSCLENPRDGSLVDCCLRGCTESDMTKAT